MASDPEPLERGAAAPVAAVAGRTVKPAMVARESSGRTVPRERDAAMRTRDDRPASGALEMAGEASTVQEHERLLARLLELSVVLVQAEGDVHVAALVHADGHHPPAVHQVLCRGRVLDRPQGRQHLPLSVGQAGPSRRAVFVCRLMLPPVAPRP